MSKRQRVCIATPIRRMPHPRMDASRKAVVGTSRHKIACLELRDESLISRARNTLLSSFMQTDNEWMYWWDDDIETANIGGSTGNLIDMLVSHGKPFVGGLYSTRGLGGHCAGRAYRNTAETRLWEVEYLGGGSMLINRSVVESLVDDFAELAYEPRSNCGATGATVYGFFQPYIYHGEYLSEDFAFCQRWRTAGGRIYADLDVRLWHWGEAPFGLADPRQNAKVDAYQHKTQATPTK